MTIIKEQGSNTLLTFTTEEEFLAFHVGMINKLGGELYSQIKTQVISEKTHRAFQFVTADYNQYIKD